MIKVIKSGTVKRVACSYCGALLSYNPDEDVIAYIKCPKCGKRIRLDKK